VHVIVAAVDAATRAELRAKALGAGLPCDEEAASPALLEDRLALHESMEEILVIVAEHEGAGLARLALGRGVPVLTWPARGADTGFTHSSLRRRVLPRDEVDSRSRRGPPEVGTRRLTPREREILALVAAGTSNKSIARSLRISPNTVKFHMTTVFAKLGVTTRAEAIAAAARSGELSL
jgi:DNA-binding CsgD family transcriptional regulator